MALPRQAAGEIDVTTTPAEITPEWVTAVVDTLLAEYGEMTAEILIVSETDREALLPSEEFKGFRSEVEKIQVADAAEVIRRIRGNHFVVAYQAYISAGNEPPQPCDPGEGTPGVEPTPSRQFTDSAEQILPAADPTISGCRPVTATITATAIAAVDWGDGTVTTHS